MYSADDFVLVKELHATGLSDYQIARVTGISRGTIQRWRHREVPPGVGFCEWRAGGLDVAAVRSYCYLLGIYLGDGWATHRRPNGWTLKVACDQRTGGSFRGHRGTGANLPRLAGTPPAITDGGIRSDLVVASLDWHRLSQHGPGRKHERKIVLDEWQLELTHAHPGALVRGLIHSDGCRCVNSFKTKLPSGRIAAYSYVRYFFTNYSADIRAIFTEHCELLGVRVTQPNHRNLAVSHRGSVAILERLVGPKS